VEWSLKFATDPAVLKAEEKKAKEGRLNIWKDWVPPVKNSAAAEGEYVGVLSEAKTGDTVIVTKEDGSEEQLVLSSVRANRLGNPRQDKPYEPCSYEARELVRNYVGKKVKVSLEYTRTLPAFDDGNPGRVLTHASVMVGQNFGDNLAAKLLEAGLVQVVKHRDDDDRSAHYDDLMTADAVAAKAEKGLYQKPLPAARRFNDMTTMGGAQANSRLSSLQRLGKIRAVVEYITNGARYKLFIPKEGTFLNFAIEGIQCPSTGRNGEPDEPCAAEALAFAKSTLLQRDVYIEIASCNKGGCFTGSLLYNKKIPFAEILLTKGFAWVSGYRAPDSLRELEAKAKAAKLKLWETYVEPSGDAEETEGEAEYMEATVSHVTEGGNFHVQLRDDKGLDFITEQLASLDIAGKPQPDQCPPKGAKVCACWDDGAWFAPPPRLQPSRGA
jgi:staphylococcal nuclease domain-containing protein 1